MRILSRTLGLATATLALVIGATARANLTVDFSYSGTSAGVTESGTGSFSFASTLTSVNLSDLASFNFSIQTDEPPSLTGEFTFGLSDLSSFSATVGPGPTLTSLSLTTNFV